MTPVFEIIIVKLFRAPRAVYSENLSYPPHSAVRFCPYCKFNNFICVVLSVERFALLNIIARTVIHFAWVAKFLEIYRTAADSLFILAKLFLAFYNLTLVV